MSKKITALFYAVVFMVFPGVAFAIPSAVGSLVDIMQRILGFIWPIFLGFAIIMFIVAGFLFLTAQGESSKLKLARDSVIYGVVGVIVGILAFSIPLIIGNTLGTGL